MDIAKIGLGLLLMDLNSNAISQCKGFRGMKAMLKGRSGVEGQHRGSRIVEVGSALNGYTARDGVRNGARGLSDAPRVTVTYISANSFFTSVCDMRS